MLFASTRSTLVRELGTEKFDDTVFATEEDEILGREAWSERDGDKAGVGREALMGEKERELEAVRRAEAEARSGTPQRDIGIGGTFGPGTGSGMRVSMPVAEEAKSALKELGDGGLVQLVWIFASSTIFYKCWVEGCGRHGFIYKANIWFSNADCGYPHRDYHPCRQSVWGSTGLCCHPHLLHFASVFLLSLPRLGCGSVHLHVPHGIIHQGAHAARQFAEKCYHGRRSGGTQDQQEGME